MSRAEKGASAPEAESSMRPQVVGDRRRLRGVRRWVAFALAGLAVTLVAVPAAHAIGRTVYPVAPPLAAPIYGLREALADRPDPVSNRRLSGPSAPIPAGTWRPLGPAAIGPSYLAGGGSFGGVNSGRITSLARISSGSHSRRIVAGAAGGGIWTSDDNGATWTARSDFAANLAIGALAVDPSNADHLIAGTGEGNQCGDCFAGTGILVSGDGGTSWTLQNPGGAFTGLHVEQVAIDPSNPKHQFAATDDGLYITTDGGNSWAKPTDRSYAAVDGNITAVVIDPANPSIVYIGGGARTVAESTDGGAHWAAANTGIAPPGSLPLVALAIAGSSPSTMYASVGSVNPVALYKSTDSGRSWSSLAAPDYTSFAYSYGSGTGGQGVYDNVLAVDPANADHLIAGGIALVESSDGGKSWSNVNGQPFFGEATNTLHEDQHALAFAPDGSVWVGNDGGVYHYSPLEGAVANANGDLDITQFYFGFNVVGNALLAGSQDNASSRTTSASLAAWTGIYGGDGGSSVITSNDSRVQFIEGNRSLYVTTDGFQSTLKDITPRQLGLFTPPMIMVPSTADPSNPTVFYGGADLWRTTDPTSPSPTWTQVTSVGQYVSAIAASPTNPQVVYVGFKNGTIEVSTDGGASFTPLASAPTSETYVTGLSVDPANPKAITASFSYAPTRRRHGFPHVQQYVYGTDPSAGTWTMITGSGLPAAVSRVIYDSGALVAGTDSGVYATGAPSGDSTVWTRVGSGLPNVQVQDLYLDSAGLYVITHGRGAWQLPVATPHPSPPRRGGR